MESTPRFTSFNEDYSKIEGNDMWKNWRQCYYDKKIAKDNGSQKYKGKNLHQAVKETLSRF